MTHADLISQKRRKKKGLNDHNPTMLIHGFSTIGKGSFVVTVDKMNPISIPPFPSQVNSHHPMS